MFIPRSRQTVTWICLALLAAVGSSPSLVFGGESSQDTLRVLSIGQPKASAAGLKIWSNKAPGQSFKEGDRVTVSFQTDRDAYVTALAVSPDGSVTLVYPGGDASSGKVEKGKAYTLFGDDALPRLILGKQTDGPRLVLYVTSRPVQVGPLSGLKGKGMVTIPAGAVENIKGLQKTLEALARDAEFNREYVSLTDNEKEGFEVNASLAAGKPGAPTGRILKKLPTAVDSSAPETVTGVQGVKTEPPK